MKFNFMSTSKLLLGHSHAYSFMCHNGTTETIWVRKPKIFTIWLFIEKLAEQVK